MWSFAWNSCSIPYILTFILSIPREHAQYGLWNWSHRDGKGAWRLGGLRSLCLDISVLQLNWNLLNCLQYINYSLQNTFTIILSLVFTPTTESRFLPRCYKWGSWDSQRLGDLPNVTQQTVEPRVKTRPSDLCVTSQAFLHWALTHTQLWAGGCWEPWKEDSHCPAPGDLQSMGSRWCLQFLAQMATNIYSLDLQDFL